MLSKKTSKYECCITKAGGLGHNNKISRISGLVLTCGVDFNVDIFIMI